MQMKCRCGFSQAGWEHWDHWDSSVHPVVQTSALVLINVYNTEDVIFNMNFKMNHLPASRGCCCPFLCNANFSNDGTTRGR